MTNRKNISLGNINGITHHIVRPEEINNLAWLTFNEWNKHAKNQALRAPQAQMQILKNYRKMKEWFDYIRYKDISNIIKNLF